MALSEHMKRHIISVFIPGDVNFAQLIKVVFSRFLHYNLIISPSIINKKAFDKI